MSLVSLAPVTRADAPALIRANAASRDYHRPWVSPCTDSGGFDAWFATLRSGNGVALLARCQESGDIAGVFSFSQIFLGNFCSAYLGFYGMAAFAGRGYMSAALQQTVRHGFDEIGLHRIEANIQPDNLRSLTLVRRAGFRREGFSPAYLRIGGIWRDHERWALLATEI
jgi:ribosomal-protein-alanine N-acetyltransferase